MPSMTLGSIRCEAGQKASGLIEVTNRVDGTPLGFPVIILIAGNKQTEAYEIVNEGLGDLPIRLEVYGREYVNKVDFIAERMKALVEEYRGEGGRG